MVISDLCQQLEKVRLRFGDIAVYSGGAVITGLAVLPLTAVEPAAEQTKVGFVVSILSRESDRGEPRIT